MWQFLSEHLLRKDGMSETLSPKSGKDGEQPPSSDDNDNDNDNDNGKDDDIQTIQAECSNMVLLLKSLHKEEEDIQCQLEILAKEALLCGFQNDVIEPPVPKKRTKKTKGK
eukprot:jgi/Psemu1/290073/fgenesh1_pg.445_\